MNNQQAIAIGNACELPQQCANTRYRSVQRKGKYSVSIMLTLNVGRE